jgi:hypothetical protein
MHTMGLFERSRTDRPPSPPPSRWKRRLVGACLGLFGLLLLAPVLVAKTPLRSWLVARALPQFRGDIRIGGASLWWFSAPVFTDIQVRDISGRTLLAAPRVEGSKSLIALLRDPTDLGELRLEQPAVHIVCSHYSTNAEDALSYWLQRKEASTGSESPLEGLAVRAECRGARVVVEDEDSGRTWTIDPVNLSVMVPHDRRTPVQLMLNAAVADAHTNGRLSADVSAHLIEASGAVRIRASGELHAEELPLAFAEPFLRRFEPQLKLDGRLGADLRLISGDDQPGAPDIRLAGQLSVRALALGDPLLGPDILRLARVETPCRIALEGSRLLVEQLDVCSEVGKVSLAGSIDLAQDLRGALNQSGHRLDADLDLVRLAGLVPNTLRLTKDTRISSGTLALRVRSSARPESVQWEGDLRTSDLEGVYQGQPITWKEPLSIVFTAHQEANAWPVFERFRCTSDFLQAEMSGSVDEWTVRAGFNLSRFGEHLVGFVDLGPLRLQGQGSARLSAKRSPRGSYRLEGDVQLNQFNLSDGARAWREDRLTVRLDLVGETVPRGTFRVNAGGLHVLAGQDGIDVDLLEPIADVAALRAARARMRVHGELARWRDRLRSVTGALDSVRLAGQVDVDSRLRCEAEAVQFEDLKVAGHGVQIHGLGLSMDEPSLDFTTSGRWLPARETLELQHTRLSCPTVTVQAPAATVAMDQTGALQVTTGATVQGDIARLYRCLQGTPANAPDTLAGSLAGRIDLRPDEGRQVVQLDVNVQHLALGSPASPSWSEPRVHVTGQGTYDLLKDALVIRQLHLDSPTLTCDASGDLSALRGDMNLSLEGKLGYDLEKLEPQLRPYLGQGVKLAGHDIRPFRITGALAAPAGKPLNVALGTSQPALMARLSGEAGLSWQSLQALGCQVGPAEFHGRLADGWFRASPIDATLNQGRLHLEPSLRLEPGPMEVQLSKGRVIDKARLTPAACASALGYALPVLADVAQVEGELSMDLESARVPLTDPLRAELAGRLTIHAAQVGPGPLVRELSVLLKGPATLTLAKENVVPILVANGRVYHSGLELRFPELTVRTSGSVGLDGTLALVAEMPVPPKWLGTGKLSRAVAGQTVRLPIGGTIRKPTIDERALREASARFARDAAENALRQELDGKMKQEVDNGLKKLFRPRK